MPIHDGTRVTAGTFHDFHQGWIIALRNALNRGLPADYFAMADQGVSGPIPDIIALHRDGSTKGRSSTPDAAVAETPPRVRFVKQAREAEIYARRANRIVIHHVEGDVVAVIEIVSPGNKSSRHAIRTFVRKARAL